MKAILVDSAKNLVWSDVPDPVIKADEVLVDIHAAALNRADLLQRQGKYPPPPGWPEWMGLEVSGVIADIGPEAAQNSTWQIGDAVCALLGGGGYAQRVAVRYDLLMPIPRGLTFTEAAALPEAFATSYLNLFIEGHLQAGQNAFIPAGASGLASVAIPWPRRSAPGVITSVLSEPIAASIQPSQRRYRNQQRQRGSRRCPRTGICGRAGRSMSPWIAWAARPWARACPSWPTAGPGS
jgi:NADPH2:quinone reductase